MLTLPAAPARAEEAIAHAGWEAGAMLATLVYGPTKVAYALVGSLVGGLAWLCTGGDGEVATAILQSAAYGDYVVTPGVLRGEESLEFVGRHQETPTSTAAGDGVPDSGGVSSEGF